MEPADLAFEGITRSFAGRRAVDSVSLALPRGGFAALLGPSGSGKSTLLRVAAGFERPDAGRVLLAGRDVTAEPPERRDLNLVFQNYALFPHLDVAGNVAFGLRRSGATRAELARRVGEMLDLVRLPGFEARRVGTLSGGERQRVALARALAPRPRVLLLDEPLSALDRSLRRGMQEELKRLRRESGCSFLLVTHDQEEALSMADLVAVLRDGRLEQVGSPSEVYDRPATRFVASFVGTANYPGDDGILLRPEKLRLGPGPRSVEAVVEEVLYAGATSSVVLRDGPRRLVVAAPPGSLKPGDRATVGWDPADGVQVPG